jgi:hypothetical protein
METTVRTETSGEWTFRVQSDDPEIRALEVCVTALQTLNEDVQARAVRYLRDRYSA